MAEQPKVNTHIIGIENDVVSQIMKAQTEAMKDFKREIEGIGQSLKVLEARIPEAIAKATKGTADFYSQGGSAGASRPTGGGTAGPSISPGASHAGSTYRSHGNTPAGFRESLSGLQEWGPGGEGEQAYRGGQYTRFGVPFYDAQTARSEVSRFASTPRSVAGAVTVGLENIAGRPWSSFDGSSNRGSGRSGSASTPMGGSATGGSDPMSGGRIIPRFTNQHYTSQDTGNFIADILNAGSGYFGNRGNNLTSRSMGASSAILSRASSDYLPYANLINQQMVQPMRQAAANRSGIGASQGISPQGGDVDLPGGFGFRSNSFLFNPAARRGLQMQVNAAFDARAAGISTSDVMGIYGNLSGLGYKYDTGRFGQAAATMEGLTRLNPNLNNPLTYQMMDQATRYRGTDSMGDFKRVMTDLNNTVKDTTMSLDYMQQQAFKFGTFNQSIGGTALGGQRTAAEFMRATGVPSDALMKLQQSGLGQANLMLRTGAMPYAQGLLDPAQKIQGAYGALNQMMAIAPKTPTITYDALGQKHTISGRDNAIAFTATQLGMQPEEVRNLLNSQRRVTAFERVSQEFGNDVKDKSGWSTGGYIQKGGSNIWAGMKKQLMRTPGVTKEDIAAIETEGKTKRRGNWDLLFGGADTPFGGLVNSSKVGETADERTRMMKKFQEIQSRETKKSQDSKSSAQVGDVTISLDSKAAKMFNLSSAAKDVANAGGMALAQSTLNPMGTASSIAKLVTGG